MEAGFKAPTAHVYPVYTGLFIHPGTGAHRRPGLWPVGEIGLADVQTLFRFHPVLSEERRSGESDTLHLDSH